MNIALLGGSFDPPHIGHYLVIRQLLDFRPDIDKILLVPAYQHQWKPSFASVKDRLAMTEYLIQEKTKISDVELQRRGVSYAIDTVKNIKQQTKATLYWIAGSDILFEFDRWEKTDELLDLATFLIFPRDPYHLPKNLPKGFELIENKSLITTNISSTKIRERIQQGLSIKHLVPQQVQSYITQHSLYKK